MFPSVDVWAICRWQEFDLEIGIFGCSGLQNHERRFTPLARSHLMWPFLDLGAFKAALGRFFDPAQLSGAIPREFGMSLQTNIALQIP